MLTEWPLQHKNTCPCCFALLESKKPNSYWEHIQSKHSISCVEYNLYREHESAYAIRYLRGHSSTDTCMGDIEECIKDMARAHLLFCDKKDEEHLPIEEK